MKLTRRQLEWGARLDFLDGIAPWLLPFPLLPLFVAWVVLEMISRRSP